MEIIIACFYSVEHLFFTKQVSKAGMGTRFFTMRVPKAGIPTRFLGKRVSKAGRGTRISIFFKIVFDQPPRYL